MPANSIFPLVKAIERQPLVMAANDNLLQVLACMSQAKRSYVLVVDHQQHLVGLFTERDLVRLTAERQPMGSLTLGQAMQRHPMVLTETQLDNVLMVLTQMRHARVRHLPIVSAQGSLTGMLTYEGIRQLLKPIDLLRLRRVEEVMVPQVICVHPGVSGLDLIRQLHQHQVSCLVVTQTGQPGLPPLGMVTEGDILRLQLQASPPPLHTWQATQIMSSPVRSTQPQVTLWQAHQHMQIYGVRRLAVVDEQERLIGLITPTSLMQGLDLIETHMAIDTLREVVADRTQDLSQSNQTLQRQVHERRRAKAALQKQISRERLVNRIADRIRESLNLENILATTVTEVQQFLQAERAFIYQFQGSTVGHIAVECTQASCSTLRGNAQLEAVLHRIQPEFYQQGRLYSIPDLETTDIPSPGLQLFRQLPIRSLMIAPIATKTGLWGLLMLNQCSGPRRWEKLEIDLVRQLATQVGIAIQQAELYAQLAAANARLDQLAHADGLTQVANRRQFDQSLEREWQRATREQQPLALIMMDIDYFKGFNDTYGHQAGDDCLKAVAQAIQATARRPADLVARYGGEEFVALLPNTSLAGATAVAEGIQQQIQGLQIDHAGSQVSAWVTLSLGVAVTVPHSGQSMEDFMRQADQTLYAAKVAGRDRYQVANS